MYERIRLVRNQLGLTRASFGSKIGVSGDVINNLERGRVEVKEHMVKLICSIYGVNEDWLRTGNGEMFAPISDEEQLHQIFTEIEFSDDALIKKVVQAYWKLDDKEKTVIHKMIDSLLK